MKVYCDSSFLIALYLPIDRFSEKAKQWMISHPYSILFTPFLRLEIRSALRQRSARRDCSQEMVVEAIRRLDLDLKEGFLIHSKFDIVDVLRFADQLSEKSPLNRTLDLIHVASALHSESTHFLTFDFRQIDLAKKVGFKVPQLT